MEIRPVAKKKIAQSSVFLFSVAHASANVRAAKRKARDEMVMGIEIRSMARNSKLKNVKEYSNCPRCWTSINRQVKISLQGSY